MIYLLSLACLLAGVSSFLHSGRYVRPNYIVTKTAPLSMGLFDAFKGDPEAKARKEAEIAEQMQAQKEMLERRNNPKKMREYEDKIDERRMEYAKERAVYNLKNGEKVRSTELKKTSIQQKEVEPVKVVTAAEAYPEDEGPRVVVRQKKSTLSVEERVPAFAESTEEEAEESSEVAKPDVLADVMKGFGSIFNKK